MSRAPAAAPDRCRPFRARNRARSGRIRRSAGCRCRDRGARAAAARDHRRSPAARASRRERSFTVERRGAGGSARSRARAPRRHGGSSRQVTRTDKCLCGLQSLPWPPKPGRPLAASPPPGAPPRSARPMVDGSRVCRSFACGQYGRAGLEGKGHAAGDTRPRSQIRPRVERPGWRRGLNGAASPTPTTGTALAPSDNRSPCSPGSRRCGSTPTFATTI